MNKSNAGSSASITLSTKLLSMWARLSGVAGGKWIFSRLLGRLIPYTGALGAKVVELSPGHARVELRERRGVRNHLGSVHAAALTNLGELASGLAMMTAAQPGVRGIPICLNTEFIKKARGLLSAESNATFPVVSESTDHEAVAEIRDEAGDMVARVTAVWRISPIK